LYFRAEGFCQVVVGTFDGSAKKQQQARRVPSHRDFWDPCRFHLSNSATGRTLCLKTIPREHIDINLHPTKITDTQCTLIGRLIVDFYLKISLWVKSLTPASLKTLRRQEKKKQDLLSSLCVFASLRELPLCVLASLREFVFTPTQKNRYRFQSPVFGSILSLYNSRIDSLCGSVSM